MLLLVLHSWGYVWMPITFHDFITVHLPGVVKICLSGIPFLIWRSKSIKLGFYNLCSLGAITEKLKISFLMYALFYVSGTVLQYHDQSCLCFFFFFFNMEKGKVPKEGTSAGILYPKFMPTTIFVHCYVTLGNICYTAGNSLPFCFFENGGTVSSLFCHQLKKWYYTSKLPIWKFL